MTRPSWDKTRMSLVKVMSDRSVCKHYQVGVLFYRGKKAVISGYNGPPVGEPHCNEVGCAKEDENGNMIRGEKASLVDSKDNIVWTEDKLIATLGVYNLVIVQSGDSILVCDKDRVQDIKKLRAEIEKKPNLKKFL